MYKLKAIADTDFNVAQNVQHNDLSLTLMKALWLTLSLLMMTPEAFVDSVDQDQNVESDLWSTPSILDLPIQIITMLSFILQWKCNFSQWKSLIYLFSCERVKRKMLDTSYSQFSPECFQKATFSKLYNAGTVC